MLVPPDDQAHPLRDVLHVERLVQGRSRSEVLLVPVLVQHEQAYRVLHASLRLLEHHLTIRKQLVQDLVLDIAQSVQGNPCIRPRLVDDQWSDDDTAQVQMLSEVIDIVAGLEEVAGGYLAELVSGVVVVAVDGEDRQGDTQSRVIEVAAVGRAIE